MKKALLLLLIFPLFIACGGDNEDKDELDDIVGTVWDGPDHLSLVIRTKTECELVFSYEEFSYTSHYTYTYKNGTISAVSKDEGGITTFKGSIKGSTLVIVYDSEKEEYVFNKR